MDHLVFQESGRILVCKKGLEGSQVYRGFQKDPGREIFIQKDPEGSL